MQPTGASYHKMGPASQQMHNPQQQQQQQFNDQLQLQLQMQHQLHQHHQMQHQLQMQRAPSNNMASFVARLMSLNAHQLQCLHSDSELMRHFTETQMLVESRLQLMGKQQQQQHQVASSPSSSPSSSNQQNSNSQHNSSVADYYAQAATISAYYNQQLVLTGTGQQHPYQLALDLSTTNQSPTHSQQQLYMAALRQQQHQLMNQNHAHNQLLQLASHFPGAATPNHQHTSSLAAAHYPASCSSAASSPITAEHPASSSSSSSSSYCSSSSPAVESHHQQLVSNCAKQQSGAPNPSVNPKKAKLTEYQKQQQQQQNIQDTQILSPVNQLNICSSSATNNNHYNSISSNSPDLQAPKPKPQQTPTPSTSAKKYKGEFDEPTPEEVEARRRMLARPDNYHYHQAANGKFPESCACVLGSEFQDKPVSQVLAMIERWRQLDTEERIKTKWDVSDLPKDIPLANIKKFEELRREASRGRADFGGASKRKPLGIRGTRQFLLILYCLWGHPGREDVMQKEGYCPHCFAKIKKANEQSTLVRVVNHFNMKHRRGANPRLSPNRDISPTVNESHHHQQQQQLMLLHRSQSPASATLQQQQQQQPPICVSTSNNSNNHLPPVPSPATSPAVSLGGASSSTSVTCTPPSSPSATTDATTLSTQSNFSSPTSASQEERQVQSSSFSPNAKRQKLTPPTSKSTPRASPTSPRPSQCQAGSSTLVAEAVDSLLKLGT